MMYCSKTLEIIFGFYIIVKISNKIFEIIKYFALFFFFFFLKNKEFISFLIAFKLH